MTAEPESPSSPMSFRAARRAFIAACEKAHVETVARLQPGKAPDGMPLFMDCAALGPRTATRAVLAVGHDAKDSALLIALLSEAPPPGTRLVLVHALDPAAFAGTGADPAWAMAGLGSVAIEDLSRVRHLGLLALTRSDDSLLPVLQTNLPQTVLTILPQSATAAVARATIAGFFAAN
jgi:hypothetical protein